MKYFFLIILILPWALSAQRFEIQLDRQEMTIADQESVHLSIDSEASAIEAIDLESWKNAGIEWMQEPSLESQQSLTFTIFDTGYFVLPPLLAIINGDSIYSNDLAINVLSVATDSTHIAPIKDIVQEPIRFWDVAPFVLGFILLVGGILFLNHLRNRNQPSAQQIEVYRPAHEVAMQKLKMLEEQGLWQKGEVKAYQSGLTYIIREYLENRYAVKALESTTEEILNYPEVRQIDGEQQSRLRNILNIADLVKFAKAKPTAEVHKQFMDTARTFILKTKKEEVLHATSASEN